MKFKNLLSSIADTHSKLHLNASKAVNLSLTLRNWIIGYYIVEYEQNGEDRANYGERLLNSIAEKCKHISGVDERALRNFRLFYKTYYSFTEEIKKTGFSHLLPEKKDINRTLVTEKAIRGTVSPELQNIELQSNICPTFDKLSYSHFELLIKLSDVHKRDFYETECIKGNWSVRELKRQINSLYYERSTLSINPEKLSDRIESKTETISAVNIIKSVYAFEFLGLKTQDAVEETDLETALLDNLQAFMLEMGHGFCFEARQKKILIGDEFFFIDLVFYHRILKCHILVELKVEEFNHDNIGQLNTYVNYYKDQIMRSDDNPTIGILLVTNKNEALAQYATAGIDNTLFISKYLLELPSKHQLEKFVKEEVKKWKR